MKKEIVEVPVLSEAVRALGVPAVAGDPTVRHPNGQAGARRHRNTDRNIAEGAAPLPRSGRHDNGERRHGKDLCSQSRFYNAINRVYAKHFPENPPSRTFVSVAGWPMEFDIEIEAVAVE